MSQVQNNPYGNLSSQVHNALNELESSDFHYEPQNANEIFKLENSVQIMYELDSMHNYLHWASMVWLLSLFI